MKDIDGLIRSRKILITCGTGGVGKTTVSAAIALRAAVLGKKAVVITIDPAKRLATSLGLKELGDHPTDLTPLLRKALARPGSPFPVESKLGSMAAIMPDTQKTFESFIDSLSSSPSVADRIKRNPIFQMIAKEFSGSNEYMSMERLYALEQEAEFDLIVLDTPPSRNSLAFLAAPQLLSQFFEEKLIRWLVMPTNKLLQGGLRKAFGLLENLTGSDFMSNLFEFAAAIFEIRLQFSANLKAIMDLLGSEDVGFLMVAPASSETMPDLTHFVSSIEGQRFHFDGLILNRCLSYLPEFPKESDVSSRSKQHDLREQALSVLAALQKRELQAIDELLRVDAARGKPCIQLPELARDVHSVEDLLHVASALDHLCRVGHDLGHGQRASGRKA